MKTSPTPITVSNLRQLRAAKAQKSRIVAKTIPAPVGGWNARDSIAAMDQKDAVELINFFPNATDVIPRYGASQYLALTPITYSLMTYNGLSSQLLAIPSNGIVYKVTSAGASTFLNPAGSTTLTLTDPKAEYVNFATTGGNYLILVNGSDLLLAYDGTTWTNPAITGVDASTFSNVNAHKFRLWFVQKNSLKAWYLTTSSIAGAASSLDLSSVATEGGHLVAMATWTLDAGFGADDLAVFITSNGQVIVYRGTDPSSASTWALVGVFELGSPIGKRCWTKYKGDLLILTQDGLVPLSGALQSSRLDPKIAVTEKIMTAISEATAAYGSNFGWQIIPLPKINMLLINVPTLEFQRAEQYVMNTITGSWCRFQGWDATCWVLFNDDAYFANANSGTSLSVAICKAWTGTYDNAAQITSKAIQAFGFFGSPAQQKRFTIIRPTFYTDGPISGELLFNVNYDRVYHTSGLKTFTPPASSGAQWDSAVWDTDLWSDQFVAFQVRTGTRGIGYSGAPVMKIVSIGSYTKWIATDVLLEPGGFT